MDSKSSRAQDKETLQGLSLPEAEHPQRAAEGSRLPLRQRYHFLVETEDGEGMSLGEDELSVYLKQHDSAEEPGRTGI